MPDAPNTLIVRGNQCHFNGNIMRCSFGKNGFTDNKKEGDHATPIGRFHLRECWFRADRITLLETRLNVKEITQLSGWCDDPAHEKYNLPVSLPFDASHEKMWRNDQAYDLVIPLGYNDDPVIKNAGSAIFLHLERDNYVPTEGCIALSKTDMLRILPHLDANTVIDMDKA